MADSEHKQIMFPVVHLVYIHFFPNCNRLIYQI